MNACAGDGPVPLPEVVAPAQDDVNEVGDTVVAPEQAQVEVGVGKGSHAVVLDLRAIHQVGLEQRVERGEAPEVGAAGDADGAGAIPLAAVMRLQEQHVLSVHLVKQDVLDITNRRQERVRQGGPAVAVAAGRAADCAALLPDQLERRGGVVRLVHDTRMHDAGHDDVVVAAAAILDGADDGPVPAQAVLALGHTRERRLARIERRVVHPVGAVEAKCRAVEDEVGALPGHVGAQERLGIHLGRIPAALQALLVGNPGVVQKQLALGQVGLGLHGANLARWAPAANASGGGTRPGR